MVNVEADIEEEGGRIWRLKLAGAGGGGGRGRGGRGSMTIRERLEIVNW